MRNVAIAILGLLAVSGCTNPGAYMPPDGLVDPISKQCYGVIREQEFVACTNAVRSGQYYFVPKRGFEAIQEEMEERNAESASGEKGARRYTKQLEDH
ncbi:hypothetical protein LJR030_004000 [Rhizobium sp. LjRoot30]|uniref:hypothetical protein n=1 Tax=Rhizobium sp. LjRoot30 TaxID=3342320 RepID=UPI003ECDC2EC